MSDVRRGYKIFTADLCSPVQGGEPVWDGTLPFELPKVALDSSDADTEVQKQAVFAISQRPKDESVPLLIKIAKTHASPAVRKQAIFWLGQTGDERAVDFFKEILLK